MTGTVFDIKEFSLHDGPGGRVTVFLKGCPLRCKWCHNPEGLKKGKQLLVKTAQCTNCGLCKRPCDHLECQPYGRCIKVCPKNLVRICGTEYQAKDLANKILEYSDFFELNNGGVTFSGGEPLLQHEFVKEVCSHLKNVHKAIQTSGYADEDVFKSTIKYFDYVMMDIKIADREKHREFTGVYNDVILKNFKFLKNSGIPYIIRVPLIPDITDTEENLKGISAIVGDSPVELLSYNQMAGAKYESVGMEYLLTKDKNKTPDLSIFQNAKLSK